MKATRSCPTALPDYRPVRLGGFTGPALLGGDSTPCMRGMIGGRLKLSGVRTSALTLGGFGPGGGMVILMAERYVQNV
jgi:hypothetical protein